MTGLYRLGGVGIVDVTVVEGQVVGRLKATEECPGIALDSSVLQGSFEGSLFVGQVTVCQAGPSCVAQKTYPFLGFWADEQLVGSLRLDEACSSPALDSGALFVTSATAEERQKVLGDKSGSAADVARKGGRSLESAISEGTALVKNGKYTEALAILRDAQTQDPDNVSVLYLTGVAHANLKQSKNAVEPFRRAAELARTRKLAPSLVGEIHFNLACALVQEKRAKEAIAALNAGFDYAGEAGFTLDDLLKNPDLAPIRREKDFQTLTARVRLAGKPKGKPPK
ncbi:MAG: tetratricopeptide repeat protein [Myxococcota bacterium]